MGDLDQEIQKIDALISEFTDGSLQQEHILTVTNTVALLKNRILNEKKDYKGTSFGGYSKTKVPTFFFWGKSLSKGAEDKIQKAGRHLSYEEFRRLNNRPVDAKNYSFSGKMFQNVGVIGVQTTETTISVVIGGQTTRAKKLLKYHKERDGVNLLSPSQDEIQTVVKAANERLTNILSNYYES